MFRVLPSTVLDAAARPFSHKACHVYSRTLLSARPLFFSTSASLREPSEKAKARREFIIVDDAEGESDSNTPIDENNFDDGGAWWYMHHMNKGIWGAIPRKDILPYQKMLDLYALLPTRVLFDSAEATSISSPPSPTICAPIHHGHHLVYFCDPEDLEYVRKDGSPSINEPPSLFARRLWTGGKIKWKYSCAEDGLRTHIPSVVRTLRTIVDLTGFERGNPTLSLTEKRWYFREPEGDEFKWPLYYRSSFRPLFKQMGKLRPVIQEERTFSYFQPFDPEKKQPVKRGALLSLALILYFSSCSMV